MFYRAKHKLIDAYLPENIRILGRAFKKLEKFAIWRGTEGGILTVGLLLESGELRSPLGTPTGLVEPVILKENGHL